MTGINGNGTNGHIPEVFGHLNAPYGDDGWDAIPAFDEPPSDFGANRAGNGHARGADGDWHHHPVSLFDPTGLDAIAVPRRRWVVGDWIPWGRVTGLYGHGGEGKTLLAQQLQTATALGQPWIGLPVTPVRSISFFCEDDLDEMHIRQYDINALYGVSFADLGNMRWVPRLGLNNVLMDARTGSSRLSRYFDEIVDAARDFGAQLVFIDTVADTYDGEENNRQQVRHYVQTCLGGIARAIGGTVVACAHPSRTGILEGSGDGGSTAWHNSFRSRLYLVSPKTDEGEPPDPNRRVLRRMKANYAARGTEIELGWQDGVLVERQTSVFLDGIERRHAERVFMDLVDAALAENSPISSNPKGGYYAPTFFSKRPEDQREGYKKLDFERAMHAMLAAGAIVNKPFGPPAQGRTRIVRTGRG
jgi:hypothetical protein